MRNTVHHTNQKELIPISVSVKDNYGNVVASGNYTTAGTYNLSFTPASAGANYTLEFHMTKASAFCFFRVDDVLVSYDDTTTVTVCKEVEDGYRYGYQGQLRDDEISGKGNSYTAEFWQYSPRLGKRWNIDPVVKPHRSPYDAFSNNPIIMIDPNGADDYFNADGSYNKEMSEKHKKDGQQIWVLSGNGGNKILLSDIPLKTPTDRNVAEKIFKMYALKIGITHIKLGTGGKTDEKGVAYTINDAETYISISGGKISEVFSNYYDLMSILEHEKIHSERTSDNYGLSHAEVYLEQTKGDYFKKTTQGFKDYLVDAMLGQIVDGLASFDKEQDVDEFLKEFNKTNEKIIGYKIEYLGKGDFQNYSSFTFKVGNRKETFKVDDKGSVKHVGKTTSPKY